MPVRFLKNASELADVSVESPLPVQVTNARPVPADTLLVIATDATTTNRDLFSSTSTELPTLDGCGQYRKLVWFYFRTSDAATNYRILARATDHNGAPLGTGWQELVPPTTLPGGANSWNRIEIPASGDGYYDQYRIEVQRTAGSSNYTLTSKIIGVR